MPCGRPLDGGNQQLLLFIATFDCDDIAFMLEHECRPLRCILTLHGGDRCAVAIFVMCSFRVVCSWLGSTSRHSPISLVSNASANALFPRVFWWLPVAACLENDGYFLVYSIRACETTTPTCHVGDVMCYQLMLFDNIRQLASFASLSLRRHLLRLRFIRNSRSSGAADCPLSNRLWCTTILRDVSMARCPPNLPSCASRAIKPRWHAFALMEKCSFV